MHSSVRYILVVLAGIVLTGWLASFRQSGQAYSPSNAIEEGFLQDMRKLEGSVKTLQQMLVDTDEDNFEFSQEIYLKVRTQYKTVETILAHIQQEVTVQRLNGAPLPKIDPMEESQPIVIEPTGLQVIDELMYSEEMFEEIPAIDAQLKKFRREIQLLNKFFAGKVGLNDRLIIEACRSELIRILTLSLSGFDTPGSVNGLKDSRVALKSVADIMMQYQDWLVAEEKLDMALDMQARFEAAQDFLKGRQSFSNVDRMGFLRDHLDPLYGLLYDVHVALKLETVYEISPLHPAVNYRGRHIFSDEFFDGDSFVKLDAKYSTPEKITLGRYLFFDPVLSKSNERTCASCHQADKAFTDGQRRSIATDYDGTVERNSPTLVNAVYSRKFFHDLRSPELEMQVDHVVFSEKEFNTDYSALLKRLKSSPEYVDLFMAAYPRYEGTGRSPINSNTVKGALASYVKSLSSFNSPFDRYARGETEEIDPAVARGFNLFMGKAVCGTCHFAPTFNGTIPPYFQDSESEVLGVPAEADWHKAKLDPDMGRVANGVPLDGSDIFAYSFKTPTVRNIALTAPYMHNGVYETLEEVVRFYNVGGGDGIGIHLENQTLPFDNLNLSQREMDDLVTFMEALTDTTGMTAVPTRLPVFPEDLPYAKRVVGGKY